MVDKGAKEGHRGAKQQVAAEPALEDGAGGLALKDFLGLLVRVAVAVNCKDDKERKDAHKVAARLCSSL